MHRFASTYSVAALAISALTCATALAQETREMDAHEHGVGSLNIAVDGTVMVMEFEAPGADIVGFEYEATSAEDLATIESAIATLEQPLDLFIPSADADCSLAEAEAGLIAEDDHDKHDHEEHDHDDEHGHEEHDHDDEHDHGDHDHGDEHADHSDHDDHAHEASHTEFHAHYTINCSQMGALEEIGFAYFETFPNALELEVQIITDSGAQAFEVERQEPTLDLRTLF